MREAKLLNEKELINLIEKTKNTGVFRLSGREGIYTVNVENNNLTLHGDGEALEVYSDRAILLNNYKLLLQEIEDLTWLELSIFIPLDLSI
jgi:hypothetical protein